MRIRANVLNLFLIDRGVKYSCVFERDVDVVLGSAKWDLSITFVTPLHLILESAYWNLQYWNLLESKQCSTFALDMRIAMHLALPSCLDSPLPSFDGIGRRDWQTMGR